MNSDLKYQIALTRIPNVGDILAKKLVAYCGGVEAVFTENKKALLGIPGVGEHVAKSVISHKVFDRVEEEIKFIEKNNIQPLFYLDEKFPKRLTHCADSPVMLYFKGEADFNAEKIIAVVGTRDNTKYGQDITEKFIADLKGQNIIVVSGLAYGIDILAHRACVKEAIPTIGVLAHGLDDIYPGVHASTANKMLENGGLLTEFLSNTNPDKENFPKRNRIVAGMVDAVVVIESKKDGGSLITADIACSYSRDVFAFPGRVNDVTSEGCNYYIKQNKAGLITSAKDMLLAMRWEEDTKKKPVQRQLFVSLTPEEEVLVDQLKNGAQHIDELCVNAKFSMSKVSSLLLNLEFSGVVKSLPGKKYQLN